jgi:hypothetical protein
MESNLAPARHLDDFYRYATDDVPTSGFKATDPLRRALLPGQ